MTAAQRLKSVAYLCAEFGIDSNLPTYSGGLGILAGDLISEAGDQDYPMTGIGILYKGVDFLQHINSDGNEEKRTSEFDHDASFLRHTTDSTGKPIIINLDTPDGTIANLKAYQIKLSDKTILYFLSSDIDGNSDYWIHDMDRLYAGDTASQIRQQIILAVGGIRLLKKLNKLPDIFHINEGRPCFIIWELTKIFMEEGLSFEDAWAKAKTQIVYTNHTLVLAGNLSYPKEEVAYWAAPYARNLGISVEDLIKDGLVDNYFNITKFALNISSKHSAVSKVHGEYAKRDWPDYTWLSITNGVYMPRWQDSDFRNTALSDRQIWDQHIIKKRELAETVIKRTGIGYDHNRLVIGWARRLAEYKQPTVIFENLSKLTDIITNTDRPVQLLFAGNSHSFDHHAKGLIDRLIQLFSGQLNGHAIFIPDYNIALANNLTSGCDIWLNTPMGSLEASGTSGMKALSNGVLNCTVIDGWTHEVEWKDIGWTLDPQNVSHDFYSKLENEIIPMYHDRNEEGLPTEWISRMKRSIDLSKDFSTERVLKDYIQKLY